ncbi:hypothetical protein H2202_002571 [Exophiala xenobiotica]|nr:hypothetical protein H2202_002571 [Exophiala xenobiotica]KAK5293033.1 hypothetical protein LTR14_005382 [Exophiala xenobiotica]KAK5404816.1 hypothetical protein LTR06_009537 [Exophiala xenobiotica]KAK5484635.1 hypothetical protein LTR55_006131 [Exophiala xenobiotica]
MATTSLLCSALSSIHLSSPSNPIENLPAEVRRDIYAQCVELCAFGLLYANKTLYNEFIPFLREDFVLAFHIDPSASSTVVKIINPDNSPWGNRSTIDTASPHPDHSILDAMPVDCFKSIRILVDAPDVNDPGQLVRGWLQSNGLVRGLFPRWADPSSWPRTEADIVIPKGRSTSRLPPVTIQVRDRETAKWHVGGLWNQSVPSYDRWDPVTKTSSFHHSDPRSYSDVAIILRSFSQIRNTEILAIELPHDAPSTESMDDFTNELTSSCIQKRSFGLDLREEKWNDGDELGFEDAFHVWLDYLLDDLNGPAAAFLRRDRFKLWCSAYEYQMGRHFHGFSCRGKFPGGAWGYLEDQLLKHIQKSYHDKFMSAREHVLAAQRDILRRHGHSVALQMDQEIGASHYYDQLKRHGLQANLGTEETFWETCYPDGIEPKSWNENWEDTQQIGLIRRLELPEVATEPTACQTFPPFIGGCKSCDKDPVLIKVIMGFRQNTRDYLFKSRPRPARS